MGWEFCGVGMMEFEWNNGYWIGGFEFFLRFGQWCERIGRFGGWRGLLHWQGALALGMDAGAE